VLGKIKRSKVWFVGETRRAISQNNTKAGRGGNSGGGGKLLPGYRGGGGLT